MPEFKRNDVVRYVHGGEVITILGSFEDLDGDRYYIILPESEDKPQVYEAEAFEKRYKLVPKYEEGGIYLSADYSKAFLYRKGIMHRLFARPMIDGNRADGKTGYNLSPASYEDEYGPLVKWVAGRG